MKTLIKLVTISFLLVFSLQSFAQISFGPKAGLNYSKSQESLFSSYSSYYGTYDYKFVANYQFGAVINLKLSSIISIQPEFLFSKKGWRYEYWDDATIDPINVKEDLALNYLEMPLLLKVGFGKNFKFFGTFGPYVAYALNGEYQTDSTFYVGNVVYEETTSGDILFEREPYNYSGDDRYWFAGDYNQIDFGVYVGVGFGKRIGFGTLLLDIRYGIGLANIEKTDWLYSSENALKNRNLSLTLSYLFGKEKKKKE